MKDKPYLKAIQKRAKKGPKKIVLELNPETIKVSEEAISEIIDLEIECYPETRKAKNEFKKEMMIRIKARISRYANSGKNLTLTELVNMITFSATQKEIKILREKPATTEEE